MHQGAAARKSFWLSHPHGARLEPVGDDRGRESPSAARTFSPGAIAQIAAVARALPASWCVAIEPPYGQLVITPRRGYRFRYLTLVVLPDGRHGAAHAPDHRKRLELASARPDHS
jgi:hypothetical protein